jgi:hypothetical protein
VVTESSTTGGPVSGEERSAQDDGMLPGEQLLHGDEAAEPAAAPETGPGAGDGGTDGDAPTFPG